MKTSVYSYNITTIIIKSFKDNETEWNIVLLPKLRMGYWTILLSLNGVGQLTTANNVGNKTLFNTASSTLNMLQDNNVVIS